MAQWSARDAQLARELQDAEFAAALEPLSAIARSLTVPPRDEDELLARGASLTAAQQEVVQARMGPLGPLRDGLDTCFGRCCGSTAVRRCLLCLLNLLGLLLMGAVLAALATHFFLLGRIWYTLFSKDHRFVVPLGDGGLVLAYLLANTLLSLCIFPPAFRCICCCLWFEIVRRGGLPLQERQRLVCNFFASWVLVALGGAMLAREIEAIRTLAAWDLGFLWSFVILTVVKSCAEGYEASWGKDVREDMTTDAILELERVAFDPAVFDDVTVPKACSVCMEEFTGATYVSAGAVVGDRATDARGRVAIVVEAGPRPTVALDGVRLPAAGWHVEPIVRLPCSTRHVFHIACVEQWLRRRGTCPLCRAPVLAAEYVRLSDRPDSP